MTVLTDDEYRKACADRGILPEYIESEVLLRKASILLNKANALLPSSASLYYVVSVRKKEE